MRDIMHRLARHPSAYGPPRGPWARLRRLGALAIGLWLLWAGVLSDHSLVRLWQVERQNARVEREAVEAQAEAERVGRQLRDPDERRDLAEQVLREEHGLARKGEQVYRVDGSTADSTGR
jgi:cell division protein FtsB